MENTKNTGSPVSKKGTSRQWHEDFRVLVEKAAEVEVLRDETTWVSFRRYSSFKKKHERLEGVVGGVEYAGLIEEFLPLLSMGQLTHVGKRAVFGLGRYSIVEAHDGS